MGLRSLGLSHEDAPDKDDWRLRIKEQPANVSLPGKWPFKWYECDTYFSK